MDINEYKKKTDPLWTSMRMMCGDGYDRAEIAHQENWKVQSCWGAHGWDLGSWPYVMVFFRGLDVLVNVEGDTEMYTAPDIAVRNAIVDEIAFFWWNHANEPWVAGIENTEQAPSYLKGPYSPNRHEEYTEPHSCENTVVLEVKSKYTLTKE